jgi:hypothetical protein
VHGGQLAVAALLEEFGLAERIEREPAPDWRTHRGKGYTPLVWTGPNCATASPPGRLPGRRRAAQPGRALQSVLGGGEAARSDQHRGMVARHGRTGLAGVAAGSAAPLCHGHLARAEPGRSPHPGRTECFFDDPQIEVSGRSLERARIHYQGRRALAWQRLMHGPRFRGLERELQPMDRAAGSQGGRVA